MANNVFANGREISCKKADGKSICCFPDVCFTPPDKVPPTPPGIPIPYPNTGMAKDTTNGSKSVKISDQEVLLKNKSYFKKTTGNEAGAAQKKGILTSKNTGKAYFTSWSINVKVEGENVVRHLDLTTHNHGSNPNTLTIVYLDNVAPAEIPEECKDANKQQRAAEQALPPAKKRAGHVTAGAHFKPTGQTFKASSNVSASDIARSPGTFKGFSLGIAPRHAPKPGVSSVKCGGKKHVYKNSGSSPTGDAEAKIIENLFASHDGKPPNGTLYIKVDGAPVCCDCQALMNCAGKSIKIVVCPPARKDECKS